MNYLNSFCLAIISIAATAANSADFYIQSFDNCPISRIIITGEIKAGDSKRFKNLILRADNERRGKCDLTDPPRVMLDSLGGDVEESLTIGRALRNQAYPMYTGVAKGAKCYSSCVFIYSAGVLRTAIGEIGIHRPYFSNLSPRATIENIRNTREKHNAMLRQYLEEMDIATSLLDAMLAVSPNEIKVLDFNELKHYRLSERDSNYEERLNAKAASFYSLTSSEYRNREAQGKQLCGASDIDCRNAIFIGVTVSEWINRKESARNECSTISQDYAKEECYKRYMKAVK
jgi:hypothetical protein